MKVSSVKSLLRAVAALPAAGVAVDCPKTIRVEQCDVVTVFIQYTAAVAAGAVQVNVDWIAPFEPWSGINTRAHGVTNAGGVLIPETYQLQGPGAVGTINYAFELQVPAGQRFLQLSVQEVGDIANPGTCAVGAAAGQL